MDNAQTQQPQDEHFGSDNPAASPQKGPAIVIAILAIASFTVGFLLVHFTLPDANKVSDEPENCATNEQPGEMNSSAETDAIESPNDSIENEQDNDIQLDDPSAGGLPTVPPGATPDGIRMDGAPLYFKCWANADDTSGTKECDRLRVLEKRMATRLYIVNECREKHASASDLGLLSLGANLDFSDSSIKFWSGPSSTVANATKIGNCVRQKLAGLPLDSIDHKFGKYRLFFSVDFFDPKQREKMLAQKRKNGREVKVTMDKVNVREEPVDGASLGRISSDSTVVLLKKNETGEWCQVLTPNNREGWMICTALKL